MNTTSDKTQPQLARKNEDSRAHLAETTAAQAGPPPAPAEPPIVVPAPPAESADQTGPAFDLAAAMKQLGGREKLLRDMVTYLETQSREVFAQIRQAQDDGDAEALARAAHALKGTLVYLGAAPAVAAVKRVEQLGRAGELAAAAPACRDLEQEVARLQHALGPYCPGG